MYGRTMQLAVKSQLVSSLGLQLAVEQARENSQ